MRTYYSFQVPKTTDKTYNLELMGLWGWAELTTGIIVGSLPVMPRFVQHVRPKFLKTFSFRWNHEVSPAPAMQALDEIPKAKMIPNIQRTFAKYGGSNISEPLNDPYSPQARLHGNYLPPITFDSTLPHEIAALEPTHPPRPIFAIRRDDLEYGQSET